MFLRGNVPVAPVLFHMPACSLVYSRVRLLLGFLGDVVAEFFFPTFWSHFHRAMPFIIIESIFFPSMPSSFPVVFPQEDQVSDLDLDCLWHLKALTSRTPLNFLVLGEGCTPTAAAWAWTRAWPMSQHPGTLAKTNEGETQIEIPTCRPLMPDWPGIVDPT